jgi:hypothetical protein
MERNRPGAGIPPGKFLSTVKEMAGRWEVVEDAGLHSLAKSVEQAGEVVMISDLTILSPKSIVIRRDA